LKKTENTHCDVPLGNQVPSPEQAVGRSARRGGVKMGVSFPYRMFVCFYCPGALATLPAPGDMENFDEAFN
jgi:hypothetical protein